MRKTTLLLLLLIGSAAFAQDTLRVMSYNLLNFPDPNPDGKEDTLANILQWQPVDILIVQELKDSIGADLVLDHSLNVGGVTRFSQAEFIRMQSDPFETHKITQHLYYDHNKLTLHKQELLLTSVRDLNVYTLYPNSFGPAQDTSFITIYGVHFKSSQGATNEQLRLSMVDTLLQHMATLPIDHTVMVAGDFNVYTNLEPSFTSLISNANWIIMQDPADEIGDWHNNPSYANIHSQSTRASSIFSDGAGGGMDDRFDHMLLSTNAMQPWAVMHYVPNSYRSLGNSGDCYNQSLTDCTGGSTPASIRQSLYYMSDHTPQYLELVHDPLVSSIEQSHHPLVEMLVRPIGIGVEVSFSGNNVAGSLDVTDLMGRHVSSTTLVGRTSIELSLDPGLYLITFTTSTDRITQKILIQQQ